MKKILFCLIILPAFIINLNAQQRINKTLEDYSIFLSAVEGSTKSAAKSYDDIEGSPYLNENFANGEIQYIDGTTFSGIPLRYNIYSDEIEFKKGDEAQNIADKKNVKYATLDKAIFTCTYYKKKNSIKNGFLIIIKEGKYSLLLKKNIRYQKESEPQAYSEQKPARFSKALDEYYIQKKDDVAKDVNSKSSFKKVFADKQDVLNFIKKEKISSKEEDLLKLLDFLNK